MNVRMRGLESATSPPLLFSPYNSQPNHPPKRRITQNPPPLHPLLSHLPTAPHRQLNQPPPKLPRRRHHARNPRSQHRRQRPLRHPLRPRQRLADQGIRGRVDVAGPHRVGAQGWEAAGGWEGEEGEFGTAFCGAEAGG